MSRRKEPVGWAARVVEVLLGPSTVRRRKKGKRRKEPAGWLEQTLEVVLGRRAVGKPRKMKKGLHSMKRKGVGSKKASRRKALPGEAVIIAVAAMMAAIAARVRSERPPRMAQFALLLIPKRTREYLVGDLEEEYRTIVLPQRGRFRARLWYWQQTGIAVIRYLWPVMKRILGLAAIWKVIGR